MNMGETAFFKKIDMAEKDPSNMSIEELKAAIVAMEEQVRNDEILPPTELLDTEGHDSGFGSLENMADEHKRKLAELQQRRDELETV